VKPNCLKSRLIGDFAQQSAGPYISATIWSKDPYLSLPFDKGSSEFFGQECEVLFRMQTGHRQHGHQAGAQRSEDEL
jgi:hypothetical protein